MKNVLITLSGGQDSTTLLYGLSHDPFVKSIHAIVFDYGQRNIVEVSAAQEIWGEGEERFSSFSDLEVIRIPGLLKSISPLVGEGAMPLYASKEDEEKAIGNTVHNAFVPMRNLLFGVIAANRAAALGCDTVAMGMCESGARNFPDSTREFIIAMEYAIQEGGVNVNIYTPLMYQTKTQSIRHSLSLPGWYRAMRLSRSSYSNVWPPLFNEADHAALGRRASFEEAGIADPAIVQAALDGLCPMPKGYDTVKTFHDAEVIAGAVP